MARRAFGEVARRTRALFTTGRRVCDGVDGRLRYELRATWLGGTRILDRLERAEFDVVRASSDPRRDGRGRDRLARHPVELTAAVARDTSFYYSFLVLPPEKRRAIVAVWDFCRAVDDAVDEAAGTTDGQAGRGAWRAGAVSWRAASTAERPRRRRGARCSR